MSTLSINLLKVFSPIPSTFVSSSTDLNPPFSSLYLIIASALVSPIPVRVFNSSLVAVFILTIAFLLCGA